MEDRKYERYSNEAKYLSDMYWLHKELAANSSSKTKVEILKKFRDSEEYRRNERYFDMMFNYIYDKDITFGVTSEKVRGFSKEVDIPYYTTIHAMLEDLAERRLTGDRALATINSAINNLLFEPCEGAADMLLMIIDKDFKCGVNVKTMAKVFPVKRPFTEYVALSNKYIGREDKVDFGKEMWVWSRKLDGNRLILIKKGDDVRCMSRQGKEFGTLDVLKRAISSVEGDFVLDGEVCIVDEDDNENFQGIMKEITRKDHTIEHPVMKVFDILTEAEFYGRMESERFLMRYERLKMFFAKNTDKIGSCFRIVEQTVVESREDLMERFAEAKAKGWEGLMIRKDVPYECGRTNNLLKIKAFFDDEYEVTGYEIGRMRFVEEGHQVEKEVLAAITINHKGYDVRVGSGFSKEQREYLHDHQDEIIGSIVKVQYFEETKNLQGGLSLRFPTVVYFYGKEGRFD